MCVFFGGGVAGVVANTNGISARKILPERQRASYLSLSLSLLSLQECIFWTPSYGNMLYVAGVAITGCEEEEVPLLLKYHHEKSTIFAIQAPPSRLTFLTLPPPPRSPPVASEAQTPNICTLGSPQ